MPKSELDRLLEQGQALEEHLDWPRALEHYASICARFPDDPRAFNKVGVVLVRLGRREEAEERFQEALRIDGDFAPSLTNIGSLRLEEGHLEEAVVWYQRALKADPDYPGALNNLAVVYRRQGRLAEAVSLLKRAGRQTALREARRSRQNLGCASSGAAVLVAFATLAGLGMWLGLHL